MKINIRSFYYRFFGYFTEDVNKDKRIRYVHLLYHLEDDTISLLGNFTNIFFTLNFMIL